VRTNIFQGAKDGILDKIWLVQFIDFGNVWGELREIQFRTFALAAGIGIRYDTIFGPFRFDWGFVCSTPRWTGPAVDSRRGNCSAKRFVTVSSTLE